MKVVSIDVKQPTTTITTTNKGGIHRVNPNFKNDAKMISAVRRPEALETNKRAQSSAFKPSKPLVSPVCVLCDSHEHLVEQCLGLLVIKVEQENVLKIFHKPHTDNNPFSEMYNPGWQNYLILLCLLSVSFVTVMNIW